MKKLNVKWAIMTSPQIQAIRERYKGSLSEKAELIADHIDAITQAQPSAVDDAHGVLHKFAGSSGMYGYDDIALLCRNAMVCAQEVDKDQLLVHLTQLKALFEEYAP